MGTGRSGRARRVQKVVRVALLVGVALAVALGLWLGSRVEVVTLRGEAPGWVVIEYENPRCPRLPASLLGRKISIPEGHYACFSDGPLLGPFEMRVQDAQGRPVGSDRILRHGFTRGDLGGTRVSADVFFYGTPEQLATSSEDAAAVLRAHHPG